MPYEVMLVKEHCRLCWHLYVILSRLDMLEDDGADVVDSLITIDFFEVVLI